MSLDVLGIFPDSFEEWRDLIIIIYGVMGIILMFVFVIVTVLLWFLVRSLIKSVRALLDDPVRPTLEEVQKTAANVRGTTEFIADTAVHPLIRIVAIGRGVRRGIATVTGLRRRSG